MPGTFKKTRNLGLGTMLVIILTASMISYCFMTDTSEMLTSAMKKNEALLSRWFNLVEAVESSEDHLHRLSQKKENSPEPVMGCIDSITRILETIKSDTIEPENLYFAVNLEIELDKYRQAVVSFTEKINSGYTSIAASRAMEDAALEFSSNMKKLSNEALNSVYNRNKKKTLSVLETTKNSRALHAAILLVSVTMTVVVAIFISRAFAKPIGKLVDATHRIANGDLTWQADIEMSGELGWLAYAFGEMTGQLTQSRKQLKYSLEHANFMTRQANTANEAKSMFLANMSHEIRTPLNAIIGFSDILSEEDMNEEHKDYIDKIAISSKSLLSIINDILDFSKIEAGTLKTENIDMSLGQLLDNVDSLMRPAAKMKKINFEILQCGRLPSKIHGDPVRLRQCLMNLTNNAIKFTEQGHVYINVSLADFNGKPFICFDIEDTGVGIEKEKIEEIFELFNQADNSHTRQYGGTGLGLAITRQLADLLGGSLKVKSNAGKGSVFSMMIPANIDVDSQEELDKYKPFEEQCDDNKKSNADITFNANILVAEDSRPNQELIKILLSKMGLQATIVEDGREAVKAAINETFDLIFMDIHMPYMDGYQASAIIKRHKVCTPIIALTAKAVEDDDINCSRAGCCRYISKPIDKHKLTEILTEFLSDENSITAKANEITTAGINEL